MDRLMIVSAPNRAAASRANPNCWVVAPGVGLTGYAFDEVSSEPGLVLSAREVEWLHSVALTRLRPNGGIIYSCAEEG